MTALAVVQNEMAGPTTFFMDGPPKVSIEWQGKNDPAGRDIQEVPEYVLDSVDFRRALRKGIYSIVQASPEKTAELNARELKETEKEQAAKQAQIDQTITREADKDMISVACVEPGCKETVLVRSKKRDDQPPLCNTHASQRDHFVLQETSEIVEGKPVRKWLKAGMGRREVEQVTQV